MRELTCREVVNFLMDYLAGELSSEECHLFEEHLSECNHCVAYLQSYKTSIRLGKAVCLEESVSVPEELTRAILVVRNRGIIEWSRNHRD